MSTIEFDKMSVDERLKCMEDLWDSLIHEKPEIKSPNWHQDILNQRRVKLESGEAKFYTIDQVKELYRK
jgi:putative addiction module component (TIGR02574 family)